MTYPQPPAPSPAAPVAPPADGSRLSAHTLTAGGLIVVGLLGLLSAFLPWVTLSAPFVGTLSFSGTEGSDGWIAVLLGLIIMACGVVRQLEYRAGLAPLSIAGTASLALFGVAIWKIIDLYTSIDDLRRHLSVGGPYGLGRAFRVSVGAGLWLMAATGAAGVVLAALMLWHPRLRGRGAETTPLWYGQPPAPYPSAGQPWPPTGQPYPGQTYFGPAGPGQPYPGPAYPAQAYPAQPYPGQPYPGQPYPGQPYPGQPYPGQTYPGQTYPGRPAGEPVPPGEPWPGQPPGSPWAPAGTAESGQQWHPAQPGQPASGQPPLAPPLAEGSPDGQPPPDDVGPDPRNAPPPAG